MFAFDPGTVTIDAHPYPHLATRGALTDYTGLEADFPAEAEFGPSLRMHGDLTYTDPQYVALMERSPSYKKLHDWVYSTGFVQQFLTLFDGVIEEKVANGELLLDPRKLEIRPDPFEARQKISVRSLRQGEQFLFPRLDLGIGRLHYGKEHGGSGIHVDNVTRLISILVYVDENPSMVGGEHRLYELDGSTPRIARIYAPEPNFMVASLQSNFAFHDVNPVSRIEGVRKAFYLAVSCSVELWRPHSNASLQRLTKNRFKPEGTEAIAFHMKRFGNRVQGKLKSMMPGA